MAENKDTTQIPAAQNIASGSTGVKTAATGAFVALLFLSLGVGVGFILFNSSPSNNPDTFLTELQKTPVVTGVNVVLAGTITGINDRELTLERNGESMVVNIRTEEPTLGKIVNPDPNDPNGFPQMEYIEFEEINVGDFASITAIIKSEGVLEGVGVTIVPDENMLPRID